MGCCIKSKLGSAIVCLDEDSTWSVAAFEALFVALIVDYELQFVYIQNDNLSIVASYIESALKVDRLRWIYVNSQTHTYISCIAWFSYHMHVCFGK